MSHSFDRPSALVSLLPLQHLHFRTSMSRPIQPKPWSLRQVQFTHEDKTFAYTFHREPTKITFQRNLDVQDSTQVVPQYLFTIYPAGDLRLVSVAVVVLYKVYTENAFHTNLVRDILPCLVGSISLSKEAWTSELKVAIHGFGGRTSIVDVDEILRFLEPYATWNSSPDETSVITNCALRCSSGSPELAGRLSPLGTGMLSVLSKSLSNGSGHSKRALEESAMVCENETATKKHKSILESTVNSKELGTRANPISIEVPSFRRIQSERLQKSKDLGKDAHPDISAPEINSGNEGDAGDKQQGNLPSSRSRLH